MCFKKQLLQEWSILPFVLSDHYLLTVLIQASILPFWSSCCCKIKLILKIWIECILFFVFCFDCSYVPNIFKRGEKSIKKKTEFDRKFDV